MSDVSTFWMVYGLKRGAPNVRHKTLDKAEVEAQRLCRMNPGEVFVGRYYT